MKKVIMMLVVAICFFVAAPAAFSLDCPVQEGTSAVFDPVNEADLVSLGFDPALPIYAATRNNSWAGLFKGNLKEYPASTLERFKVQITGSKMIVPYVGADRFDLIQFPDPSDLEVRNWALKENPFHLSTIPNQGIEKSPCIDNSGSGPAFRALAQKPRATTEKQQ
jgi:hypothetical protein